MATEVKDTRPPPPEWLNKDFVQKALRSGYEDETITVVSSEARIAHAVGDGYTSDVYRVTAQLKNSTVRSVIVKCHPQNDKRENMIKRLGIFGIELNILTKTLPAMSELLEKANPGKYPPLAPKCLYHGDEPVKFLVLEDLGRMGFTLPERQKGMDMAHCSLAVQSLARFHAASIALHVQDPDAIQCYAESIYGEKLRVDYESAMQGAMRSLANEVETWPGYKEKYVDKLNKLADTFYDRIVEVCVRKDDGYNVLIHGDPWTSNMMFKYDGNTAVDLRLLDFQTVHYSSPAIDLHYFLTTSPNEEVRMCHMDQLLQEYRSVLNQTLDELGYAERQLSVENLEKEMDERVFFGVFAAVDVLPEILSMPEDDSHLEQTQKGDNEHLKSNENIFSGEAYKSIMMRLLPMYENQGLL